MLGQERLFLPRSGFSTEPNRRSFDSASRDEAARGFAQDDTLFGIAWTARTMKGCVPVSGDGCAAIDDDDLAGGELGLHQIEIGLCDVFRFAYTTDGQPAGCVCV